jgi:exodeoxyribonuclease V alpha subunit
MVTARGERIGLGDRVATRRNDPDLGVANRQTWTVTGIGDDGSLTLRGRGRDRVLPAEYATKCVELAYATTVHGAQGESVDRVHVAIGDTTGAAAAYVAMTRGRNGNTAHLVAESVEEARKQWVEVFARDRADLGPAHAKRQAIEAVDRYGSQVLRRPVEEPRRPIPTSGGGIGI